MQHLGPFPPTTPLNRISIGLLYTAAYKQISLLRFFSVVLYRQYLQQIVRCIGKMSIQTTTKNYV